MIIQKFNLSSNYFDFNSKFDIMYIEVEKGYNKKNNYRFCYQTFSGIINNSESYELSNAYDKGRLQFINESQFFYFCYNHF